MESETERCEPCQIAVGAGIAREICEEFKGQIDCSEFEKLLTNPDTSLEEIRKSIKSLATQAQGKAKELLDETISLVTTPSAKADGFLGHARSTLPR